MSTRQHGTARLWGGILLALLHAPPALADWAPSREASRTYARGVAALDAGELDEAEVLFRSLLAQEPACGQARHALGLALLRQNKKAEALGAMEQVVAGHAEEADAWAGLSLAAFAAQDFERARTAGEQAVRLAPTSLEAQVALQEALLRLGELDLARTALLRAEGALREADLACLAAQVDLEAGEPGAAAARMGLCQEAEPALAVALQNQVAAARGDVSQAGRLAARMGLSATSGVARALDAWREGRQEEALVALDEVLELEPGRADARLLRGRVRHDLGDLPGAVTDLEAALGGEAWVDVAWTGAMSGIVRQSQERELRQRVAEGAELLVRILAEAGELERARERLADIRVELGELPEVQAAAAAVALAEGDPAAAWAALLRGLPAGEASTAWLDAAARLALLDPGALPEAGAAALRGSGDWHHRYNLALALRQQRQDAEVLALVEETMASAGLTVEVEAERRLAVLGHEAAANLGELGSADRWLARVHPPSEARPVARVNHAVLRLQDGDAAGALAILPDDEELAGLGPEVRAHVRTVQVRARVVQERWEDAYALASGPDLPAAERYWLATRLADAGRLRLADGALVGTCERLDGDTKTRCSQLRGHLGRDAGP